MDSVYWKDAQKFVENRVYIAVLFFPCNHISCLAHFIIVSPCKRLLCFTTSCHQTEAEWSDCIYKRSMLYYPLSFTWVCFCIIHRILFSLSLNKLYNVCIWGTEISCYFVRVCLFNLFLFGVWKYSREIYLFKSSL